MTVERLSVAIECQKTQPLQPGIILHPSVYLSWHSFLERFGVTKRPDPSNLQQFLQAWIFWLQQLGIDEMPYQAYWTGNIRGFIKDETEVAWANEPLEKRRAVEQMAIWVEYKSFVHLHDIPFRASFSILPQISTLPFHEIEKHYFFDVGVFSSNVDFMIKRRDWLLRLDFRDAVNLEPPHSSAETKQLNQLYMKLPVLRRKWMEAEAKFLKLVARPCSLSWRDLEAKYEVYPGSCFISFTEYKLRRGQWLQALDLNVYPFSYINIVERYNEVAEVAWSEMGPDHREMVKDHAKFLKDGLFPYIDSWLAVEDVFGFSLNVDFDGNVFEHTKRRNSWLLELKINAPSVSKVSLERRWKEIPLSSKKEILERARGAKERFCRERAASAVTSKLRVVQNDEPLQPS